MRDQATASAKPFDAQSVKPVLEGESKEPRFEDRPVSPNLRTGLSAKTVDQSRPPQHYDGRKYSRSADRMGQALSGIPDLAGAAPTPELVGDLGHHAGASGADGVPAGLEPAAGVYR